MKDAEDWHRMPDRQSMMESEQVQRIRAIQADALRSVWRTDYGVPTIGASDDWHAGFKAGALDVKMHCKRDADKLEGKKS